MRTFETIHNFIAFFFGLSTFIGVVYGLWPERKVKKQKENNSWSLALFFGENMQLVRNLVLIGVLLAATAAYAEKEGGSSGMGGGGGVIIYDDRVVIADPFIKKSGNTDLECRGGTAVSLASLPWSEKRDTAATKKLKAELQLMGHLLVRFGSSRTPRESGALLESSLFIKSDVTDNNVTYCLVDKLPDEEKLDDVELPNGALKKESVAFTRGPTTWIRKDLFASMTLHDQALQIIHERLHAAFGYVPHRVIADITEGLGLATDLFLRQQRGERPMLDASQMSKLTQLAKQIQNIRMNKEWGSPSLTSQMVVLAQGGGFAHIHSHISPKSYIGVGSLVSEEGIVYDNAELINTDLCTSWDISESDEGHSVYLYSRMDSERHEADMAMIYPGVKLKNSIFANCSQQMKIYSNAEIENSHIITSTISTKTIIGQNTRISDTVLTGFLDLEVFEDSLISSVKLSSQVGKFSNSLNIQLNIGAKSVLKNIRSSTMMGYRTSGFWTMTIFSSEKPPVLNFAPGFVMDLQGAAFCPDGGYVSFEGIHKLAKQNDRSSICE